MPKPVSIDWAALYQEVYPGLVRYVDVPGTNPDIAQSTLSFVPSTAISRSPAARPAGSPSVMFPFAAEATAPTERTVGI